MKRKSNKKNDFITAILILMCVLFIILVVYELFFDKKEEIKPARTYDANKLAEIITKYGMCSTGYDLNLIEGKQLKFEDLPKKFINNNLYSYMRINKIIKSNKESEIVSEQSPKIESFYREELNDAIEKMYGNVTYEVGDSFDLGEYTFTYDKKEDKYTTVKTKEIDCTYKKYDGYIVDSVLSEKDKVTLDLLFYNYELQVGEKGCFKFIYYATKDDEQFVGKTSDLVKENKEHFVRYRFIFVPYKSSYVFDHVELIK